MGNATPCSQAAALQSLRAIIDDVQGEMASAANRTDRAARPVIIDVDHMHLMLASDCQYRFVDLDSSCVVVAQDSPANDTGSLLAAVSELQVFDFAAGPRALDGNRSSSSSSPNAHPSLRTGTTRLARCTHFDQRCALKTLLHYETLQKSYSRRAMQEWRMVGGKMEGREENGLQQFVRYGVCAGGGCTYGQRGPGVTCAPERTGSGRHVLAGASDRANGGRPTPRLHAAPAGRRDALRNAHGV